jgi:hypothetical protein
LFETGKTEHQIPIGRKSVDDPAGIAGSRRPAEKATHPSGIGNHLLSGHVPERDRSRLRPYKGPERNRSRWGTERR